MRFHSRRQSEIKCGAASNFADGPRSPAMAIDDTLHRGKPDAMPGKFLRAVQALKSAEKLVRKFHVESRAVVAHEIDRAPGFRVHPKLDFCQLLASGEFPG